MPSMALQILFTPLMPDLGDAEPKDDQNEAGGAWTIVNGKPMLHDDF